MNYQKIYEQLTSKDMIADYTEKHHIIPRCMGGSDDPSNLVRLTPEAHYVAHQLLVKIYPGNNKLIFAAKFMTTDSQGQRVNNKLFGWLKRQISKAMQNRVTSIETRAKQSVAKKNISDETRAKYSKWQKGTTRQPHSIETKEKMSDAQKYKVRSVETKEKMSRAKKNISDETRAKYSKWQKDKSKPIRTEEDNYRIMLNRVECPHCNRKVLPDNRRHFKNCRANK